MNSWISFRSQISFLSLKKTSEKYLFSFCSFSCDFWRRSGRLRTPSFFSGVEHLSLLVANFFHFADRISFSELTACLLYLKNVSFRWIFIGEMTVKYLYFVLHCLNSSTRLLTFDKGEQLPTITFVLFYRLNYIACKTPFCSHDIQN